MSLDGNTSNPKVCPQPKWPPIIKTVVLVVIFSMFWIFFNTLKDIFKHI